MFRFTLRRLEKNRTTKFACKGRRVERKGLKFSITFFANDAISRKNGNRDRIFMMALDGRHEMKHARYSNLLLSCRKVSRMRSRRFYYHYLCFSDIKRKINEIRRKEEIRIGGNIESSAKYRSMNRSNCKLIKISFDIPPRATNRFTGAVLPYFYENLRKISSVPGHRERTMWRNVLGRILHSVLVFQEIGSGH